ncbi:MAG: hypothetical protein CYG60_05905 [Actinobacteria bacterium]|nr:MAG: hypothetical protein CYG60_05905 [Actinomycetota bacterium]
MNRLLVRARSADLTLEAKGGSVLVTPKTNLSPEMRDELRRVKGELSAYLRWDEEGAYALWKDALSYLAPFYREAGSPDFDLEALHEPWDRVEDAFACEDMFALRLAVHDWVLAGRRAISGHDAKDAGPA